VFPPLAPEVETLHEGLERFRSRIEDVLQPALDAGAWVAFVTAVVEIGQNILRHAHPDGRAEAGGLVAVQLRLCSGRLEARYSDQGVPFVPPDAALSLDVDLVDDLPEGGLGLPLARASLDELEYHRTDAGENHWRLVKRIEPRRG
jgi:anti-sigma regulatory factor (Ser/Thr protein kinase)